MVWNCESSKSPEYDGFHFNFIKNMWDLIGWDIIDFVLNFFDTGYF